MFMMPIIKFWRAVFQAVVRGPVITSIHTWSTQTVIQYLGPKSPVVLLKQ